MPPDLRDPLKKFEKFDTVIFQSARIRKFWREYTFLCTMATSIDYLKASISTLDIFFQRISAIRSSYCFVKYTLRSFMREVSVHGASCM